MIQNILLVIRYRVKKYMKVLIQLLIKTTVNPQGTALDSLLDYSMYYRLKNAFVSKQSMRNLHDGVEEKKIYPDPTVLGAFLDNHDNNRFLSLNRDWTLLKNALAYIVFAEV